MRVILCKGQILGPISGADETLVTYALQLRKAGISVSVLLMHFCSEKDHYYQRLIQGGVPVSWIASRLAHRSLGTGRKLSYKLFELIPPSRKIIRKRALRVVTSLAVRYYQQCRDYLDQQNADLMHIITPDPSAMVMIRAGHDARIPVIYQELGLPYHPPDFESYYRQFTSVLPLCAEIAALSPTLAEHCREKLLTATRISVLPIMSDDVSNGHTFEREATERVTFGFAARMEELKGPMVLMEAFEKVRAAAPTVCVKFAGDGSQREKVKARARSLNVSEHYQHYGVYTNPEERTAFMRDLDVFVMPSFTEGTPNSIVEAMANGKPIIASAVGGIPDMIDSESGILVPPGDTRALARAMTSLARNPQQRRRMGQAARERYRQLFSPQAVVPLMLETYGRIRVENRGVDLTPADKNTHPWGATP